LADFIVAPADAANAAAAAAAGSDGGCKGLSTMLVSLR